jgi:hypothetical protein
MASWRLEVLEVELAESENGADAKDMAGISPGEWKCPTRK